ncbi:MAG TPA: hypothetical protein VGM09_02625 [Bradyrhizobium sp.]
MNWQNPVFFIGFAALAGVATAHMNMAATVPMDYRFPIKDGQRSVEAQW